MPKPPTPAPQTWKEYKAKWSNCRACRLSGCRSRIVICRGSLPADILFVGEAPGGSEDVLGRPFAGPEGNLLDRVIESVTGQLRTSMAGMYDPPRLAFTNLVACIPKDEDGRKIVEPPKETIKACGPRLNDLVKLAKPQALVMVGKLSGKWVPQIVDYDFEHSADIIHPAAILRLDQSQRDLAIQKTQVVLRDLFLDVLGVPF